MHDPLQRLVKVKLSFLATMVTVVGLTLLFISHWAGGGQSFHWLSKLPITDLGSDLFTTGFVVIAFNYVEGRDSEERATERLRRVLTAEAPAIRDAVIDGFAFDPSDLARVSTPETLNRVICNSLALRLGDATFAEEVYADIRDQAVAAVERWHDGWAFPRSGVAFVWVLEDEFKARRSA
jgi:hypothetical protein